MQLDVNKTRMQISYIRVVILVVCKVRVSMVGGQLMGKMQMNKMYGQLM